jgi:hypothetical protein
MQQAPPLEREDQEHLQQVERHCWHGHEVDGDRAREVCTHDRPCALTAEETIQILIATSQKGAAAISLRGKIRRLPRLVPEGATLAA